MDLSQSEESQNADSFGVEFVNTSDSNDECKFGLSGNVDLPCELSLTLKNEIPISSQ